MTIVTGAVAFVAVLRAWALLRLLRRFPPGSGRSLSLLLAMRGSPAALHALIPGPCINPIKLDHHIKTLKAQVILGCRERARYHIRCDTIYYYGSYATSVVGAGGYGNVLTRRMAKLDKWALNIVGGVVLPLTMAAEDEEARLAQ